MKYDPVQTPISVDNGHIVSYISSGADCAAFHVFFAPAQSCDVGTCYVHGKPLDSFVPNAEAIAYDKQAQA